MAPTSSPSSENLTNIKGLSSWELLQNHYQRIGSIHKADYFPSVSSFFLSFILGLFLVSLSIFRLPPWLLVLTLCVGIPLRLMMM